MNCTIKMLTQVLVIVLTTDVAFISAGMCDHVPALTDVHGGLVHIKDTEVSAEYDADRALHTLPPGLVVKQSSIPNAGLGVFTLREFPAKVVFGPYGGEKTHNGIAADKGGYAWMIRDAKGQVIHYIDAQYKATSNWLRYVNSSPSKIGENMIAFQYLDGIYYRSDKVIPSGTELLVWYGDAYGRRLGLLPPLKEKGVCGGKKRSGNESDEAECPLCDGNDECGVDFDAGVCPSCCVRNEFRCKNGNCLAYIELCDGYNDCGDNSDESFCSPSCSKNSFRCNSGECIPATKVCDGATDCTDGLDEAFCACLQLVSAA